MCCSPLFYGVKLHRQLFIISLGVLFSNLLQISPSNSGRKSKTTSGGTKVAHHEQQPNLEGATLKAETEKRSNGKSERWNG